MDSRCAACLSTELHRRGSLCRNARRSPGRTGSDERADSGNCDEPASNIVNRRIRDTEWITDTGGAGSCSSERCTVLSHLLLLHGRLDEHDHQLLAFWRIELQRASDAAYPTIQEGIADQRVLHL